MNGELDLTVEDLANQLKTNINKEGWGFMSEKRPVYKAENAQFVVVEDFERDEDDHVEPQEFTAKNLEAAVKLRFELELLEYAFNENEDEMKSLIAEGYSISETLQILRKRFEQEFDEEESYYIIKEVK